MERCNLSRNFEQENFYDEYAHCWARRSFERNFYREGVLAAANGYAKNALGDIKGKRVLDLGCGKGTTSVEFAKDGAMVSAIDMSKEMVKATRRIVQKYGVEGRVNVNQMTVEDLKFPDALFDCVYGHSILHHIDLETGSREIKRVLRKGGKAVFVEPLGHNFFLRLYRKFTPRSRTRSEKPLMFGDIRKIARNFSRFKYETFYLLSLLPFIWRIIFKNENRFQKSFRQFQVLDNFILEHFFFLRKYCWIIVLEFTK